MKRFFYMQWEDTESPTRAKGGFDLPQLHQLADLRRVVDWPPLQLMIDAEPADYLVNDAVVRLCSPRLRSVIDTVGGEVGDLQWLDASVATSTGEVLRYFVLHFPSLPDVLDRGQTLTNGPHVVRPVVSLTRAAGYHILGFNPGGIRTIVSAELKRAIVEVGCTGVGFENVKQV